MRFKPIKALMEHNIDIYMNISIFAANMTQCQMGFELEFFDFQ